MYVTPAAGLRVGNYLLGHPRTYTTMRIQLLALALIPAVLQAQAKCDADNAGLKLPPGFCATVFADTVAGARQIAVAPNGDVIVSSRRGVVILRDTDKDGHADTRSIFATVSGTTHVGLSNGWLYTESGRAGGRGGPPTTTAIVRFPYKPGDLTTTAAPDTIVQELPNSPGHSSRNFALSRDGALYVNVGSATNSCQMTDRTAKAPGANPCTELETRAGVWKFDANKQHQTQATGVHFARGIRNAVGITMDPSGNRLWTTQHGRDQLGGPTPGSWDFDAKYNAENPAEELLQVNRGDDYGWPYCYYAVDEKKLVLAPEYGGDGKKLGSCADKKEPVATFPGHWAPNALMFYTGAMFPPKYRNGAFIAFHGSWNRAPEPQAGFNVVFQPVNGQKAGGPFEVFADGFFTTPGTGRANAQSGARRPTGLAQGPDGALYIADDNGGRIWRVVYSGR
jgi:glucose/arabinose dehydrogenase